MIATIGTLLAQASEAGEAGTGGTPWYWWVIGFGGQAMFTSRFAVQWIASERARASVMPVSFWYLSIVGGLLSLAYAVFRLDPVFILGQATGTFVYARNLVLIERTRGRGADAPPPPPPA